MSTHTWHSAQLPINMILKFSSDVYVKSPFPQPPEVICKRHTRWWKWVPFQAIGMDGPEYFSFKNKNALIESGASLVLYELLLSSLKRYTIEVIYI